MKETRTRCYARLHSRGLTVGQRPDSQLLAIHVYHLRLIRLWNIFTNREVAALSLPSQSWHGLFGVKIMSFSKDGKTFVAASSKLVRIWNLAGASEKPVLEIYSGHQQRQKGPYMDSASFLTLHEPRWFFIAV